MARFTYVISDIHGQIDAFMSMLTQIDFTENDEMYILGDVIDRGPKSIECIKWIMARDNILTLLGNHELILYDGYINNAPAFYHSLTEIRETVDEYRYNVIDGSDDK
ncbi:MAG: metallophosphoesterase [Lachnospiraceae bacterium]|nr:metallophosphoesterase [Lachnospiraceae bacterium]